MFILKRFVLFSLFFSLCISQDFGRLKAPKSDQADTPEVEMEYADESVALEQTIDPEKYILGPGDLIGLNVITRENLTFKLVVTPTGDLFIPAVGVCQVAGYSLKQAIEIIHLYIQKNAYPDAQTHVVLLRARKFKVLVSGAVNLPGYVTLTPVSRLDDAIFQVDGFHQLAEEYAIEITRDSGQVETINYHKYLQEGDLESNPTFLEGDRIRVPFGSTAKNAIVVRGSIEGAGYDIISASETLEEYIRRQVVFRKDADLENVTISRRSESGMDHLIIAPQDFGSTVLAPGDVINFMWERGVMVIGFVQAPGGFAYFPGYSVSDYIALAGGNTNNGNPNAAVIDHLDIPDEDGLAATIMRGDVIYVPRAKKDIFFGDSSVLQIISSFATLYLTFLAVQ